MGVYADLSDRLIERGFAAIPIIPGTKKPGFRRVGVWIGLSNWQKRFNRGVPNGETRARWAEGGTGLGVIGGPASHGAVAVDIDTDDPAIMAAILGILPRTPIRKRGAKGETLFYYGPAIAESKSWKIDGKTVVDLIGPGRQTVLPPTLHPDTGEPYAWTGSGGLGDVTPADLPLLGADIVEAITAALTPFGYKAEPPISGNDGDDPTPHRELNEAALADLSAWVSDLNLFRCCRTRGGYEAVPIWRPSTTGRAPEKRHRNLKISRLGIRDFGADQGYTPLDLVMTATNCSLDEAFVFLGERLGFTDGVTIELEVPASPKPSPPEPPAGNSLEAYTSCPGLIGDIVDYIVATARRPNRVLAIATAVTVIGTLVGRRVAGPTRSATHLYTVAVGPTGCGKQHLLDSAMTLMMAAGAGAHLGPSEFISMPAVLNYIARKPLSLCVQDEYGAFLRRATHKKASVFETALSKILRTLWGTSFAAMTTPEWAGRAMTQIQSPALSILGVSTADEFHAALQGESVSNGFLNRYLVFESGLQPADRNPETEPGQVPGSLKRGLRELYQWSGPQSLLQIDDPEAAFAPDVLPWAGAQAEACYFDFVQACAGHMEAHPETKPYLARCGEIAVRLATIRAAGRRGHGAQVDAGDMEWGASIGWEAGQRLADVAISYMPSNERRDWGDKILALIKRRGSAKTRDIQGHIRGALRSAEVKDILAQFVEAGLIEWTVDGYRCL